MRISDWSSDVCSSDLRIARGYKRQRELAVAKGNLSRLREYVDRRFDPTDDTPGIDCQLVCADTATNCEPCFASWKWKQTSFGAEFKGPQRICIIGQRKRGLGPVEKDTRCYRRVTFSVRSGKTKRPVAAQSNSPRPRNQPTLRSKE